MSTKKVIAVVGITGKQGGTVARSLLKDGKYEVKGLTRDASKPNAQEWTKLGVTLVEGDVNNAESLKKLFTGCYGAFAVTNFWDNSQMHKETAIGTKMAEIAKECGVEHYVWSTLPNCEKISGGKYYVDHFTDKAKVDQKVKELGFKYHSFVLAVAYMQNFLGALEKKNEDGSVSIAWPYVGTDKLTLCDVDDCGPAAREIFDHPEEWNGKVFPVYKDTISLEDAAKQFIEVTGKKCTYTQLPTGAFGKEFQDMLDYYRDFGMFGKDYDYTKYPSKICDSFVSWREFVKKYYH